MSLIDAALNRSRTVLATLLSPVVAGAISFGAIPKEAEPDVNIPDHLCLDAPRGHFPRRFRTPADPADGSRNAVHRGREGNSRDVLLGGGNVCSNSKPASIPTSPWTMCAKRWIWSAPTCPTDTDEPTVNEVNLSLFPILIVTLSGDVPERTLMRLARDLQDAVEGIPTCSRGQNRRRPR